MALFLVYSGTKKKKCLMKLTNSYKGTPKMSLHVMTGEIILPEKILKYASYKK